MITLEKAVDLPESTDVQPSLGKGTVENLGKGYVVPRTLEKVN